MAQDFLSSIDGLRECQKQTLGDPDICIAIIDSRVDLAHPCFAGAQLKEIVPVWLQSVMGPAGASHGTHVASIIFGQQGGEVEGIAPRCRGIIIPVYGETEDGELRPCSQQDLARAIALALEAGANLINISGGELIRPGDVDQFLDQTVRTCERQDVVVVAAAGNEGCECLHAPASLPTVLAVGAADAGGRPTQYSNWDASLASHGVLAPGEGIPGAVPGNGVGLKGGTSFACPIVTGAAALLMSLQKLAGKTPSATAVRDAIVRSAIPCPPEQEQCERMLGGRLDIAGAHGLLFEGYSADPAVTGLRPETPANSIRSPPMGIAQAASVHSVGGIQSRVNGSNEGAVMTNEQIQGHPQGVAVSEQALALQEGGVPPAGVQAQAMQPSTVGAWAPPSGGDAMAAVSSMIHPAGVQQAAFAEQPALVRPQGVSPSCGCGGAQPQQAMGSAQQVVIPAQQDGFSAQRSGTPAYRGGIPVQAPFGAQPAVTPAQRTAMMAAFNGSGGSPYGSMPVGRGVAPSQTHTNIPMPTDFVTAANSQLVYVIGELGYDFITDARRDYFVQQITSMSEELKRDSDSDRPSDLVKKFESELGLKPGPLYLPEDHRAMSAYLYQHLPVHPGAEPGITENSLNPEDIGSLMWVLFQEGQPMYALRPLHTLALAVLASFANFLYDQSRLELVPSSYDKDAPEVVNPRRSDRVSIAARIIGDITLYNGQQVPVLDVSLRALFNWTIDHVVRDVLMDPDDPEATVDPDSPEYKALKNFLERVYYEVRNMGQVPSDRAVNYLATNLFQARVAFKEALAAKLELDSIYAEKSPLCRPKSDCWDVVMRFFDPNHRMEKALEEYRLTVDVNDLSPVGIGKVRHWARFA